MSTVCAFLYPTHELSRVPVSWLGVHPVQPPARGGPALTHVVWSSLGHEARHLPRGTAPAPCKAVGRGSPSGNDIGGGRGQPAVVTTAALISVSWCLCLIPAFLGGRGSPVMPAPPLPRDITLPP